MGPGRFTAGRRGHDSDAPESPPAKCNDTSRSDLTLGNLRAADTPIADMILDAFNHWDDIDVHFRGATVRSSAGALRGATINRSMADCCLMRLSERDPLSTFARKPADDRFRRIND